MISRLIFIAVQKLDLQPVLLLLQQLLPAVRFHALNVLSTVPVHASELLGGAGREIRHRGAAQSRRVFEKFREGGVVLRQ